MTEPVESIPSEPEVHAPMPDRGVLLQKARRVIGRVPLVRHVVAMYFAWRDDETPIWARTILAAAVAYFVLPTDWVPDFIVGIGFTDDAAVVLAALKTVSGVLKPRHYAKADETLERK